MGKAKLFRRGKYVGLVNYNFHDVEEDVQPSVWSELELPQIGC